MQQLNFPHYDFRFKSNENTLCIFDPLRKKFVVLQPEEWVRQHVVQYLLADRGFPASLMNVEKKLKVNTLSKRYDLVVFNSNGSIHLLVECKAPGQKITQATFDQVARYNLPLNASYLMVTNGLEHFYCRMDYQGQCYEFIPELPLYTNRIAPGNTADGGNTQL